MKHQVEPIYCYSLAPSGPALYILHSRYVHGWEGGGGMHSAAGGTSGTHTRRRSSLDNRFFTSSAAA